MANTGTAKPSDALTKVEQLTHLLRQARSADKLRREEAFNELYKYVAGPMKPLIEGVVHKRSGGRIQATEALNDAVAELFVKWPTLKVNDTGHFQAMVVQTVYWRIAAQRRANRHLRQAVADATPDPRASAADVHEAANSLDPLPRFEEAVEALADYERAATDSPEDHSPTPLADVVKARHLIGLQATSDGLLPNETFKAVADLLGITPPTACKRYWKALEWLHKNFPDVVPNLPERKKAGRKKSDNLNGGAS